MRFTSELLVLVTTLLSLAVAWSSEDHEIFRLRDSLIADEGDNVTFYSYLNINPSATFDDVRRAGRQKAKLLHPDKARAIWLKEYAKEAEEVNEGSSYRHKRKAPTQREIRNFDKRAEEVSARLNLIITILTDQRDRYDHFLYNGFPKWRGTGYYYQRFRPGLGSVLLGLFVVTGGAFHYLALWMGWRKQREFVERYITTARRTAWGGDGRRLGSNIPGLENVGASTGTGSAAGSGQPTPAGSDDEQVQNWNRREKRAAAKEKRREDKKPKRTAAAVERVRQSEISPPQDPRLSGPVGAKKRTIAENGKVLIVDSVGNVWLEEETEEGEIHEFLLDPEEIVRPTIFDTALFKLPRWAYMQSVGRFLDKRAADLELDGLVNGESPPLDEKAVSAATSINANGEARKRRAKAGRR